MASFEYYDIIRCGGGEGRGMIARGKDEVRVETSN